MTLVASIAVSLNLCWLLDGIDSTVCDQVMLIHRHDQIQLLKRGILI